jgi:hypothetical protein
MVDQKGTLLAECHQTFSSKPGPQVYHMTDFGNFSPQQGIVLRRRKGKERSIKGQVGREYLHNSLSSIIWVSELLFVISRLLMDKCCCKDLRQ